MLVIALLELLHAVDAIRRERGMQLDRRELDDWLDANASSEMSIGDRRFLRDKALEHFEWAVSELSEELLVAGVRLTSKQVEKLVEQASISNPYLPMSHVVKQIGEQTTMVLTHSKAAIARLYLSVQQLLPDSAAAKQKQEKLLTSLHALLGDAYGQVH